MKSHDAIFCTVCDLCGVANRWPGAPKRHPQNYDLSREAFLRVNTRLGFMHGSTNRWERPGQIEGQVEDARKKLKTAIEAVEKLDSFAKVLARKEARKERDSEFERRLVEVAQSGASADEKKVAFSKIFEEFPPRPPEQYVDNAAVAQMEALSKALVRPIEAAIPHVQEGRGRPRNRRAYAVAEHAYLIFEELTGQKPTFWNASETTPFGRLVEYLFKAYGIKSTLRKPIEAAMHKYAADG